MLLCGKSKLKDNLIMQHSPITRVIQREWQRMTSRRLYFGVCLVLPLFTLFFMATIFGNGQMENIPIGIVDRDKYYHFERYYLADVCRTHLPGNPPLR